MKKYISLLLVMVSSFAQANTGVTVYAASSMTDVINALIKVYESDHQVHITPVYASSSSLARQIENGAPADIFISADQRWMNYLVQRGLVSKSAEQPLAANQLVVITPFSTDKKSTDINSRDKNLDIGDAASWLEALNGQRIAIGEPNSVPAGIYAEQSMRTLGVWHNLKVHLAPSNNVRAALALVELGETPLGVVYKTDALQSQKVRIAATFPDSLHKPIVYPLAQLSQAKSAVQFARFMFSKKAAATLQHYGFTPLAGNAA
ncbi:molybdate ABC transporter substrate-binding protein [Vibrio profundum]|uniref:molybdate ABC transporter substrate-binding protein n=1 Tax=Vibrio profundum TaxID=2910247 RepID=UPI003D09D929